MVVGAFPIVKLGALLVKQISKPIANFVKERAKTSPFFRTYVCMPPAQFYNWFEVKTKMWIMNLGKPVHVPPMTEAMAIELGANLLGEGIIFVIATGVLLFEYQRQSQKEADKEAARIQETASLYRTINEVAFQVEKQNAQLSQLRRLIGDLDSRVVKLPIAIRHTQTIPDEIPFEDEVESLSSKEEEEGTIINRALFYIQNDVYGVRKL